jgi:quercetin dioxygenase-like cupin family protein
MQIKRSGSQPSQRAPAEHFTGSVRLDPMFQPSQPARAGGALVTFEPGARTDWHSHPLGQTLIITSGRGLVQLWGQPVQDIFPGDVVSIAPNEKHWHGAAAGTAMSHLAIQESLEGTPAQWLEKVSEAQYGGAR